MSFPSKNAGVRCHALLQGMLPTQDLRLLRWQPGSLPLAPLAHRGSWSLLVGEGGRSCQTPPCEVVLRLLKGASRKGAPQNFPGDPVVKNPPSSAGDVGLIPGERTKIPCATGQRSPHATTTEPVPSGAQEPQRERPVCCNKDPVWLASAPPPKKKKEKSSSVWESGKHIKKKRSCLLGCREPSGCSVHL